MDGRGMAGISSLGLNPILGNNCRGWDRNGSHTGGSFRQANSCSQKTLVSVVCIDFRLKKLSKQTELEAVSE